MTGITLSADQQNAYDTFVKFITHPEEEVLVLSGYAGTGKTTLVKYIMENLAALLKTANLLRGDDQEIEDVQLTATTNKAAEVLTQAVGFPATTIHSLLGLAVKKDYGKNTTELIATRNEALTNTVLFIDEASFIDWKLLKLIFSMVEKCKLIFIGDPAQLAPVNSKDTPVFSSPSFKTAELTEVVRQAKGNPIIELASLFRKTVKTGEFFSFTPDGTAIRHLPRDEFDAALLQDFSQPGWRYEHSKVLAWRNKTVINYNHGVRAHLEGAPQLQPGDYAVCNRFISNKSCKIKTDELVLVHSMERSTSYGVAGNAVVVKTSDGKDHTAFLPDSIEDWAALEKQAKKEDRADILRNIDTYWIDLRAAYACTVNKSQGSTFDRVYIDLDDLGACRDSNCLARMLYVGVSRARDQVIFTGDLV